MSASFAVAYPQQANALPVVLQRERNVTNTCGNGTAPGAPVEQPCRCGTLSRLPEAATQTVDVSDFLHNQGPARKRRTGLFFRAFCGLFHVVTVGKGSVLRAVTFTTVMDITSFNGREQILASAGVLRVVTFFSDIFLSPNQRNREHRNAPKQHGSTRTR